MQDAKSHPVGLPSLPGVAGYGRKPGCRKRFAGKQSADIGKFQQRGDAATVIDICVRYHQPVDLFYTSGFEKWHDHLLCDTAAAAKRRAGIEDERATFGPHYGCQALADVQDIGIQAAWRRP